MKEHDKQWFEVSGLVTFWFTDRVEASDPEEAEEIVQRTDDPAFLKLVTFIDDLTVTNVDECRADRTRKKLIDYLDRTTLR